jgi:hypothetical protein
MTDIELIDKVLKSSKPSDIFNDDWKKEYLRFSKLIHPDTNTHPNASLAMSIINKYKEFVEINALKTILLSDITLERK